MEGFLRIGLLIVAAVIVFLIMFESRARRRSLRALETESTSSSSTLFSRTDEEPKFSVQGNEPKKSSTVKTSESISDFLVMSVLAKSGQKFVSYDLLQALSSAGMRFGEMNIFHYYLPDTDKKISLFSLASATEPGEFDMSRIGDLSCSGLTLFMNLRQVPDPQHAFELMLKTAEQLADDLDGELRAGQTKPWNNEIVNQYRQKVLQHV